MYTYIYMYTLLHFTYAVGKFLDISLLNRRAENCPELTGLPLAVELSLRDSTT